MNRQISRFVLSAFLIAAGGSLIAASPLYACHQATGWCCVEGGHNPHSGWCCYFENNEIQGCNG